VIVGMVFVKINLSMDRDSIHDVNFMFILFAYYFKLMVFFLKDFLII
jgi:hypothetical protein